MKSKRLGRLFSKPWFYFNSDFSLQNDLRHDLERIELVPLYADLAKLKEKQKKYESDQKHKLTPEEEKDKLLKQFKIDNERSVILRTISEIQEFENDFIHLLIIPKL